MSDDLVKRLRDLSYNQGHDLPDRAADRIEKLEEEVGVLIAASIRLSSRIDLDSDHYVNRIEKLEAALEKIMDTDPDEGTPWFHDIARKALEGKDD